MFTNTPTTPVSTPIPTGRTSITVTNIDPAGSRGTV